MSFSRRLALSLLVTLLYCVLPVRAEPPVDLLSPKQYQQGKTDAPDISVPVGATYVEVSLDRKMLISPTLEAKVAWALELSQDGGKTWLPWGGASTMLHPTRGGRDADGALLSASSFRVALSRDIDNPLRRIRGTLTISERTTTALTLSFDTEPLPPFQPPEQPHSVAFDNAVSITFSGVSTITTGSFTIAGTNRAGILALSHNATTSSAFSGNIGGTSASLISGSDSASSGARRSQMWGVTAPPTGSQTGTMSWTTNQTGELGVVTASGVAQSSSFDGGTFSFGSSGNPSLSITSNSGDMSMDNVAHSNVETYSAPTQTSRYNTIGERGSGSTTGTGTATFGWTATAGLTTWVQAGANFKALTAVAPYRSLMGVGQ